MQYLFRLITKNFSLLFPGKSVAFTGRPVPKEGRWPSSRTLGRDAVDAAMSHALFARDERQLVAYGEVVWS
jgi:hypothetical protein